MTGAAWVIAARLQDGYVAALAESLRSGAVSLEDTRDLTTRSTLAETTALMDRQKLLARIDELQKNEGAEIDGILKTETTRLAANGLLLALKDPVFEVRRHVALAKRPPRASTELPAELLAPALELETDALREGPRCERSPDATFACAEAMASSLGGSLLVRGLSPMLFWRLASFSFAPVVIACGDDPAPAASCVPASYDTSCTPAHAPTYEAIYAATFQRSCAKSGVSCHGATGKQGGIDFDDKEQAYAALRARSVIAGDPACSDLVRRLVATDGTVRMPPGRSLPAGEQCAVIRWIEAGAGR